jgi:hypothetical protein
MNGNSDRMVPRPNIAGEERARRCGDAHNVPGTPNSYFGVHVGPLDNPR